MLSFAPTTVAKRLNAHRLSFRHMLVRPQHPQSKPDELCPLAGKPSLPPMQDQWVGGAMARRFCCSTRSSTVSPLAA
jgi:hypothetical protein